MNIAIVLRAAAGGALASGARVFVDVSLGMLGAGFLGEGLPRDRMKRRLREKATA